VIDIVTLQKRCNTESAKFSFCCVIIMFLSLPRSYKSGSLKTVVTAKRTICTQAYSGKKGTRKGKLLLPQELLTNKLQVYCISIFKLDCITNFTSIYRFVISRQIEVFIVCLHGFVCCI